MSFLNEFVLKRMVATLMCSFVPGIAMLVGIQMRGIWVGIAAFFVATMIITFLAKYILKNPFTEMLEGNGILAFNIDSPGIIKPFLLRIPQPYVKGKLGNEEVNDMYDRDAVFQLASAAKDCGTATKKDGKILFELDDAEFNRSRFGMYQYPVMIYNSQIKSLITKDFLSNIEKNSFAEHGVLFLNRKIEDLTSVLRDFARHIVELQRPKEGFFTRYPWLIWVVIIGVAIIAILFAKPVYQQVVGAASGATGGSNPISAVMQR